MGNSGVSQFRNTIKLISELQQLDQKLLHTPIAPNKWSIREIIGHLYYWDKYILEQHIPDMKQTGVLKKFPDHDSHNREAIQYITAFGSINILIEQFVHMRTLLAEALSAIDSEATFTIGIAKRKFTVDKYIKIFIDHDQHHYKQITTFLAQ